jgi:hypothetical protein
VCTALNVRSSSHFHSSNPACSLTRSARFLTFPVCRRNAFHPQGAADSRRARERPF